MPEPLTPIPTRKPPGRAKKTLTAVFGHPGLGIYRDLKGRLPYYLSDWTDSWNYRVVPATIYMYFCNLLPAIAFAQDMFDKTHDSYGVNEVLLSSAMGGIVFGVFAGQPLCIVGVTGPISIFNSLVYEIIEPLGTTYFPFMAWICLWSMVFHIVIAVFGWINSLRYVTRYSCNIFGWFICYIYIQKGIQVCTRQFKYGETTEEGLIMGYFSVVVALLTMIFGVLCILFGSEWKYTNSLVRKFVADYGTPLCVIFFTGFVHFGPRLASTPIERLPITKSFAPTFSGDGRAHGWFVHFWEISVGDVFLAIPFALLLTILFLFDHNVSSLICQGSEFPLKKPSSFHWDFLLLGITTGLAGILGIPAPNGLIPQAPLHTTSLCIVGERKTTISLRTVTDDGRGEEEEEEEEDHTYETYYESVVEQRFSNTVQGLLILGTMSRPLLVVLGLVPQAVLAGLFWIMGLGGLMHNTITERIKFLAGDKRYISKSHPLKQIQKKRHIWIFLGLELAGFAGEFGINQSVGGIGFPGVLLLFVVVGYFIPRFIPEPDMSILDQPTASDFIVANLKSTLEDVDTLAWNSMSELPVSEVLAVPVGPVVPEPSADPLTVRHRHSQRTSEDLEIVEKL